MDREAVRTELTSLIGEYLKGLGLGLVDIIFRYEGRNLVLRILADRPESGITLDECASLNRDIGIMLDEKNILQEKYILEVSSPGLDRPLKTKNDFLRCVDWPVKFFLNEPINGKWELDGIIKKLENEAVFIEIENRSIELPLSKVRKAKQIINEA